MQNNLNNFGESTGVSQDYQFVIEICELCNIDHKKLKNFSPVYKKIKEAEKAGITKLNSSNISNN